MVKSLLARVADGGGSLLVLGDPGIGKSALVQAAIRRARDRGMRVLACAGAESEAHLSFAGLHQLLRPVLAQAAGLPAGQREALLTALGMAGGPAPAVPVVGLELLGAGGRARAGGGRGRALAGRLHLRGAGVRGQAAGRGPGRAAGHRPGHRA